MNEENHNLCRVFFTNSAKTPLLLLHLVKGYFSHHGTVGSAFASQARGQVRVPTQTDALYFRGKYPGA